LATPPPPPPLRRSISKRFLASVLIACSLIVLSAEALHAQGNAVAVQGKVVDEKGEPLPGVNVAVKGTLNGTSTDADGKYKILVDDANAALVFSFVGYISQEALVGSRSELDVQLVSDQKQLDEIVVVGYDIKNKKELTGSIVKISSEEIKNLPLASPDQLLQGKAAGVQISSQSGTPGGGVTVRVRGTSSFSSNSPASQPLYIIDGVFMNTTPLGSAGYGAEQQISNPLADINPNDIESIDVLKDANATAIYGSRGANGVVIITTKRGSQGQKTRVNVNLYSGAASAWRLPKLADAAQTAELLNEVWINKGNPAARIPYPDIPSLRTYDRIPEIFRTAGTQNVDMNITGGDGKTTFYLGGGYFKQDGIMRPQTMNRQNFRINLDHQINQKLKISTSNSFTRTFRKIVPNDNSYGVMLVGLGTSALIPTYNDDGTYFQGPIGNAVRLIKESDETSTGIRAISNVYAEYEIVPKLVFKTSWSIDFNDSANRSFSSSINNGPGSPASGNEASNRQATWLNEQTLRYGFKINADHQFNLLAGNTAQKTSFKSFNVSAQNYPNDDLRTLSNASEATGWGGSLAENSLVSFFGRVDYAFKGTYILDANIRADASSKFGSSNRWGYFPSVGVAWRVSNEKFMENQNAVSNLKIKASYGLTGSQQTISDYASQGLWGGNANYKQTPGTAPSQIANSNLKWEQTTQFNAGIEFSFLKNRIDAEINFYTKYTKGVLLNQPVPYTTGFATVGANGGDISNKGIEASINAGIIRKKDFKWDVNFNIAHNKNLIEKLAAPYYEPFSRNFIIFKQGYSVNGFRLWKQERVDPQTGNAVYTDVNHDGAIDDNDRMILGSNQPKALGGFGTTLRYKGFDLNCSFSYVWGQDVVNWNTFFLVNGGTRSNASTGQATWGYFTRQLDRWQKPGDITDIPKVGGTPEEMTNNYGRFTSRALENGTYTRLRNLTLGYAIPAALLVKSGIRNLRIYVSGTNLLTFTKYSGLDPEINAGGGKGTVDGVEMFTVPQPRTIQAGITLGL